MNDNVDNIEQQMCPRLLKPVRLIPKSHDEWDTLSWGITRFQHVLCMSAGLILGNTGFYFIKSTPQLNTNIDIVRIIGGIGYFGSKFLIKRLLFYMHFHNHKFLDENIFETQRLHLRRREAIIFALSDYFYFITLGVTGAMLQKSGIVILQKLFN